MESQWSKIFGDTFVLAVAGALIGVAGVVWLFQSVSWPSTIRSIN